MVKDANRPPESAFKGAAVKVKLERNEKLWKLTSRLTKNGEKFSEWWLPYKPNDEMKTFSSRMIGFNEIQARCNNNSKGIGNYLREYIRAWCNVCYDWNELGNLVVVKAQKNIDVYIGKISSQPIVSANGVSLLKQYILDRNETQEVSSLKGKLRGMGYAHESLLKQHIIEDIIAAAEVKAGEKNAKVSFIAGSPEICQVWIPENGRSELSEVSVGAIT